MHSQISMRFAHMRSSWLAAVLVLAGACGSSAIDASQGDDDDTPVADAAPVPGDDSGAPIEPDASAPGTPDAAPLPGDPDAMPPPDEPDAAPPAARQNLLFESTWEEANPLSQWSNEQHCCAYSIGVSTEQARTGTHALRVELRADDDTVSGSVRSEVAGGDSSNVTDVDRWYGVSFYLPADYVFDTTDESLIQWHQNMSGGIPPMALWASGNQWLMVHTKSGLNTGNTYGALGAIERGKWTDFVFHIKWDDGAGGKIQVWKDGALVYDHDGVTNWDGYYMKVGVYKWPWAEANDGGSIADTRIIYVDDIRVGNAMATFDDVAP